MKTTALLRRFSAVGQRRRALLGVISAPSLNSSTSPISAAAASSTSTTTTSSRRPVAASASATTTTSSRRRMGRPKNYRLNPLLDKLDLAEDEDNESFDDEDEGGASTSSSSSRQQQQQRPLRGSLLATQTLRAVRRSPTEIASCPSRFPLSGEFEFEGAKNDSSPSSAPSSSSSFTLSSTQVIRAISPFLSEDRVERIRAVAAARCFSVLPIVEGLFDRGNLGAVCRTAEAMGIGSVWAADLSSDRYRASRGRCSAGSERWIDIQVFSSSSPSSSPYSDEDEGDDEEDKGIGLDSSGTIACLSAAKAAGFRVVVAAAGPGAIPADEFDWEAAPTAFVVGNEARGVSEVARRSCDHLVMVPMVGMVESLNVSVASACLMQAALGRIKRETGKTKENKGSFLGEEEVHALTAAMLLRHKGQQGKVGQQWQAPMFRELVARAAGAERGAL